MQQLSNDQNIVQLKLGPAKLIHSYSNLIHIINLTDYKTSIQEITNALNKMESNTNLKKELKLANLKLNHLAQTLDSLTPIKRLKRGLIDGLGTAIKFITGNMDANDANQLNDEIENLHKENSITKKLNNDQHILNSQMIKRFKNVTNFINNEQKLIQSFFEKLSNQIYKEDNTLEELQYLNQITYNIDVLDNHLKSISEAIILARLNIISKFILTTEELTFIQNSLKKETEIISNEHIYELLNLQSYYNDTNITFNVKIPHISEENYEFHNIIAIPINETKKIIVKPYLLYNNKSIQTFDTACPNINKVYYCKGEPYEISKSTCIGAILQEQTPSCHLEETEITTTIYQPRDNILLLLNIPKTLINSNCRNNRNTTIEGTAIVHFQNCTIDVNGIKYNDNPKTVWEEIHLILPTESKVEAKSTYSKVNLPKLKGYLFENKEDIRTLQAEQKSRSTYTTAAVSICGVITIITLALTLRRRVIVQYTNQPTPVIAPAFTESLWPSLYVKGGGVTSGTTVTNVPLDIA